MENPLRGIALLLAATVLFSISDSMSKVLGRTLPAVEITWIRYLVFVVMALLLMRSTGSWRFRVRRPVIQIVRGLGVLGSSVFFVLALKFMPLADAATVGFASPLLITLLSVPFLGEVVGIRRWAAVVVGMVGVLVVMRPGTGAFQPAAGIVLMSSGCWAVAMILTRLLSRDPKSVSDHATTTLLWSALTGVVVLTVLLPIEFTSPNRFEWALALTMGVFASSGQYLMLLAYRHAGASLLAPFSYVQLLWSASLGYLVFDAIPDLWTWVGAAIIMASGAYTAHRERIRAIERRALIAAEA